MDNLDFTKFNIVWLIFTSFIGNFVMGGLFGWTLLQMVKKLRSKE